MKILIHSNGPHVKTGYGVQCAQLADRLASDGHEVAISCTYGQQGTISTWVSPSGHKIPLYPVGYEVNSNDIIHNHALHWFEGDAQGGLIIPLLDLWCLVNGLLAEFNVAGWCPVDHFPVPPDVVKFFHRTDAIPVAMSHYGERQLFDAGLNPAYAPLAVDTKVYKPTRDVLVGGRTVDARTYFNIPQDAFCVGMVAMNKGWAIDRKGFNEALRAFGVFWKSHPDAVLYMHCEKLGGAEGINLVELATHASVPVHALRWVEQYPYRMGFPPEQMAAAYTAMDVLLSPSHGEGFCVPLIEAQACGTPVIATDFSAQAELIGAGWKVEGQPQWDMAQHSSLITPYIDHIVERLEEAYAADLPAMSAQAIEFAQQYDADVVYDTYWRPFIKSLEPKEPVVKPFMAEVAVIVPTMRPENLLRLTESFDATNDGTARLYLVHDEPPLAVEWVTDGRISTGQDATTYAEKVNIGVDRTKESWVFVCGDDVEFKPGWLDYARRLSDRFDVIGTNDTSGEAKNPEVARGAHADHFFVRRSYIEEEGACLDGPGVLAPEIYRHWYTDMEIIGIAKARGVFTPCLESVVEHHHPGYDGREDLRQADPVYMAAVEHQADDKAVFLSRVPLIAMQRQR